jgi:hypothetical protein
LKMPHKKTGFRIRQNPVFKIFIFLSVYLTGSSSTSQVPAL